MERYEAYGLTLESAFLLPHCPKSGRNPDVLIIREEIQLPELTPAKISRKGIEVRCGMDEENQPIIFWEGIAAFKAIGGKRLLVDPLIDDPQLLELFILSEALGMILLQRNLLILHAGAVEVNGKAWVFMGEPGSGKSTTTAAMVKAGCPLLSDDLTAVVIDNEKAFVLPSFPQLKLWHTSTQGLGLDDHELTLVREGATKFAWVPTLSANPIPLEAFFFLHKNEQEPSLCRIKPAELPIQLLANFPLPIKFLSQEVTKRMFVQSAFLAKAVDAFSFRRPVDFVALEEWVVRSTKVGVENY